MTSPDPRPVGETAEQRAETEALANLKRLGYIAGCAYIQEDALDAYRDAVAAEARAALLADAPAVWVATDDVGQPDRHSRIWAAEPVLARGRIFLSPDDVPTTPCMAMDSQIVPPGTVRRYALVPLPEEET